MIKKEDIPETIRNSTVNNAIDGGEGGFMPYGVAGIMAGAAQWYSKYSNRFFKFQIHFKYFSINFNRLPVFTVLLGLTVWPQREKRPKIQSEIFHFPLYCR